MRNHHNYARWISLYSLEFANLETSQPDVRKILIARAFCVNGIGKSFASFPVDMALEQTISANAKS